MNLEIQLGLPGPVSFEKIFGNAGPVEIELGFGKALFLLRSATEHPDCNYLGVEVSRKWFREGKRRAEKAGPPDNLRLLHAEAVDFLTRFTPPASVRALHIYYPDPWPKKRHQKRRFVAGPLLSQAERVLLPGGELRVVTDHAGYAEWIGEQLAARPALVPLEWEGDGQDLTHFEAKYRRQGRSAYRFRRRLEGPR